MVKLGLVYLWVYRSVFLGGMTRPALGVLGRWLRRWSTSRCQWHRHGSSTEPWSKFRKFPFQWRNKRCEIWVIGLAGLGHRTWLQGMWSPLDLTNSNTSIFTGDRQWRKICQTLLLSRVALLFFPRDPFLGAEEKGEGPSRPLGPTALGIGSGGWGPWDHYTGASSTEAGGAICGGNSTGNGWIRGWERCWIYIYIYIIVYIYI